MFLHRAYLLPDYVTHTSLPKLFIRIRSVAIKFKGRPELMYFTPDERRVFDVRSMVRMGGTIGCVIQLPQGEAEMNFYISAGWKQGLFQLWVHGYAGGFIPESKDGIFEVERWELYEYNLYAAPTRGRQFPDLTDRPIDNYETHNGIVVRDNNKYGLEIIERLMAERSARTKQSVDLASIGDKEPVGTIILYAGSEILGHLSFKSHVSTMAICRELGDLVPARLWLDSERELLQIAAFFEDTKKISFTIPRIIETKRFRAEMCYCNKERSVFVIEDGVPKFKLLKEQPTDNIV